MESALNDDCIRAIMAQLLRRPLTATRLDLTCKRFRQLFLDEFGLTYGVHAEQARGVVSVCRGVPTFLTGSAGTGKSMAIKALKRYVRRFRLQDTLAITAATGAAALLIGGRTIHSFTGSGICDRPVHTTVARMRRDPEKMAALRRVRILVIDEISLLDAYAMEYFERVLRELVGTTGTADPMRRRSRHTQYGGIAPLFLGDFLQLEAVDAKKHGLFYTSPLYRALNPSVKLLTTVGRQRDQAFIGILNRCRVGRATSGDLLYLQLNAMSSEPDDALRFNSLVRESDAFNQEQFRRLETPLRTIHAHTTGEPQLFGLFKSPEKLELRVGCRVMCTRNHPEAGLSSGSAGTLTRLKRRLGEWVVEVTFDNPLPAVPIKVEDEDVCIPVGEKRIRRFSFPSGEGVGVGQPSWAGVMSEPVSTAASLFSRHYIKATRTQLPFQLCWAVSIHKSQGLSVDSAVLDVSNAFAVGQVYTGLSRLRSLDRAYIRGLTLERMNHCSQSAVAFYEEIERRFMF